jgi:hypothetical protein
VPHVASQDTTIAGTYWSIHALSVVRIVNLRLIIIVIFVFHLFSSSLFFFL